MRRINLLQPTFDDQTIQELNDVLRSGWVMFGPKTLEFEKMFAEYVGAKYAIATNSATSALDLCLKVKKIKGGELITTPMTFVSDATVGEWNGMDVTFADINPRTLCIDPEAIRYTPETKAIIAVDCHGRLADIQNIRRAVDTLVDNKVFDWKERPLIIEDAAHACFTPGVGQYADMVVWSFQAVKSLPIFDGGMITTNDEEVYKKLRPMTWLGVQKLTYERVQGGRYTWDYDITLSSDEVLKAYMTDVQAVIGIGQLRRLEETNARRRQIQNRYNEAFKDLPQCKIPEDSHTVQYYTPEWERRDELSQFLAENGIHTSVHFKPLSEMTYWKKSVKRELPMTNEVWPKLLSLPVHNALTDEDQDYVIEKVKEFYAQTA